MSGRVSVTSTRPHNIITYTDEFYFQLPDLSRIETRFGSRLYELNVGDGNAFWDYTTSPKPHLIKQTPYGRFMIGGGYMLEPFLNRSLDHKSPEYIAVAPEATPTLFHGHPALRVKVRRLGRARGTKADPDVVYMDPRTHLPLGATLHSSLVNYSTEYAFEDLKVGKSIDPAMFKYHPQIAANTDPINDQLPVGTEAPLFTGVALGEKPFDLAASMKGAKAVILNFWGLGCPACRAELPKLQRLQDRFASKGLRVVTFQPLDDKKILSLYLKEAHLNLSTVFEFSCMPSSVESAYRGSIGEPVTYLIDAKGTIVSHYMTDDVTQLTKDLGTLGLKD